MKMQFFWFFYTNKRTGGVYPKGHASQGAKPPQIKNLKYIFLINLKILVYIKTIILYKIFCCSFSRLRCADFVKEPKSAS